MEIAIDPQRKRYLTHKVRSGEFESVSDVVNIALDRLKKDERDLEWLKREIQKGLDSSDRGESTEWNVKKEKARFLRRMKLARSRR